MSVQVVNQVSSPVPVLVLNSAIDPIPVELEIGDSAVLLAEDDPIVSFALTYSPSLTANTWDKNLVVLGSWTATGNQPLSCPLAGVPVVDFSLRVCNPNTVGCGFACWVQFLLYPSSAAPSATSFLRYTGSFQVAGATTVLSSVVDPNDSAIGKNTWMSMPFSVQEFSSTADSGAIGVRPSEAARNPVWSRVSLQQGSRQTILVPPFTSGTFDFSVLMWTNSTATQSLNVFIEGQLKQVFYGEV